MCHVIINIEKEVNKLSIDKILEYLVSFATFFSLMVGAFKTIQDMRITAKKDKKSDALPLRRNVANNQTGGRPPILLYILSYSI